MYTLKVSPNNVAFSFYDAADGQLCAVFHRFVQTQPPQRRKNSYSSMYSPVWLQIIRFWLIRFDWDPQSSLFELLIGFCDS